MATLREQYEEDSRRQYLRALRIRVRRSINPQMPTWAVVVSFVTCATILAFMIWSQAGVR